MNNLFQSCYRDVVLLLSSTLDQYLDRLSFYQVNHFLYRLSHMDREFSALRRYFEHHGCKNKTLSGDHVLLGIMARTQNRLGLRYCESICQDYHSGMNFASRMGNLTMVLYFFKLGCLDTITVITNAAKGRHLNLVVYLLTLIKSHVDWNCYTHYNDRISIALVCIAIDNNDSDLLDFCNTSLFQSKDMILAICRLVKCDTLGWTMFMRSKLLLSLLNTRQITDVKYLIAITLHHGDRDLVSSLSQISPLFDIAIIQDVKQKYLELTSFFQEDGLTDRLMNQGHIRHNFFAIVRSNLSSMLKESTLDKVIDICFTLEMIHSQLTRQLTRSIYGINSLLVTRMYKRLLVVYAQSDDKVALFNKFKNLIYSRWDVNDLCMFLRNLNTERGIIRFQINHERGIEAIHAMKNNVLRPIPFNMGYSGYLGRELVKQNVMLPPSLSFYQQDCPFPILLFPALKTKETTD